MRRLQASPPGEPPEVPPDPNAFQEDPYHSEPYISPEPENYGSLQPGHAEPVYESALPAVITQTPTAVTRPVTPPPPPPPTPPADEEEDDEDDPEEGGMLRMSFMEHLEELRARIIRRCTDWCVAFILCLIFAGSCGISSGSRLSTP